MKATIGTALEFELINLNRRWDNAIDAAIRTLEDARGRPVSTHLGHNLGNGAAELSMLAGKIESIKGVIAFEKAREANEVSVEVMLDAAAKEVI